MKHFNSKLVSTELNRTGIRFESHQQEILELIGGGTSNLVEYEAGQITSSNIEDEYILDLPEEQNSSDYIDLHSLDDNASSDVDFSEIHLNDFYESSSSMGGYGPDFAYIDGQWVVTYYGGVLDEVVITLGDDGTGYGVTEAVSTMLGSMGLAADHAAVAAAILKLETQGFQFASQSFGVVSAGMNFVDFAQNGDLQDAVQGSLGLLLVFGGFGGGIVVAGGLFLAAWEIYEMVTETP